MYACSSSSSSSTVPTPTGGGIVFRFRREQGGQAGQSQQNIDVRMAQGHTQTHMSHNMIQYPLLYTVQRTKMEACLNQTFSTFRRYIEKQNEYAQSLLKQQLNRKKKSHFPKWYTIHVRTDTCRHALTVCYSEHNPYTLENQNTVHACTVKARHDREFE